MAGFGRNGTTRCFENQYGSFGLAFAVVMCLGEVLHTSPAGGLEPAVSAGQKRRRPPSPTFCTGGRRCNPDNSFSPIPVSELRNWTFLVRYWIFLPFLHTYTLTYSHTSRWGKQNITRSIWPTIVDSKHCGNGSYPGVRGQGSGIRSQKRKNGYLQADVL